MRLQQSQIATFAVTSMFLIAGGVACADTGSGDQTKQMELPSGQVAVRPRKLPAVYAPLFVEQKDSPGLSKTALRLDAAPRLQQKLKD